MLCFFGSFPPQRSSEGRRARSRRRVRGKGGEEGDEANGERAVLVLVVVRQVNEATQEEPFEHDFFSPAGWS